MRIKVSEATNTQIDWLVGIACGWSPRVITRVSSENDLTGRVFLGDNELRPSTDWAQSGPIIEREISKVFRNVGGTWTAMTIKEVPLTPDEQGSSLAYSRKVQWNGSGPTLLIAAMRCYVIGLLGEIVDIPEDLE